MSHPSHQPRICVVTNSFHPAIGGGETHALLLCQEWIRRGVQVRVLTRRLTQGAPAEEVLTLPRRPQDPAAPEAGLPVRRLPPVGFRRLGKYLVTVPVYRELLRQRDAYDLVYVCGLRVAGIPAMLAARRLGKPCVLRAESRGELSGDFIWQSPDPAIRRTPLKPLIRAAIRWRNRLLLQAPAFVSISRDIHDEFGREGVPADRNHLILNGIDTSRFAPASPDERRRQRRELGLPGQPLFLYTGKLNQGKGLEMLLEAWRKTAEQNSAGLLVLVGGGGGQHLSCEQALRTNVRTWGLQDRVVFAGFQTDVHRYLQAADVFVFPSENEALSIALLEAQSCELPCLASDITGNRDIVTDAHNGRLLPVGDVSAWSQAMHQALANPASMAPLGKAGRQTAVTRFGISRVAEEHLRLFSRLLSDSPRSPAS